ncbi:MAG: methyl-accepting chemotaxis protein [Oscillospiraceae bacterium]|nr:methyl-accepting chemotaxis protein [Oscillospiraceae bacterium]MCL2248335.1 methyl-accepting chemotaxis protein [Oscillospiraceae bacterium]
MKNLKVAKKLIVSFLIAIALTAVVGVIGIIGMQQITAGSSEMYENQLIPIVDMSFAREYFQRMRVQTRNIAINTGNHELVEKYVNEFTDREQQFLHFFNEFRQVLTSTEGISMADEIENLFYTVFSPGMDAVQQGAREGLPTEQLMEIMAETTAAADQISANMDTILEVRLEQSEALEKGNEAMSLTLLIVIIVVLAFAIAVALFLAIYISRLISKPLSVLSAWMKNAALTGEILMSDKDRKQILELGKVRDEIGETIKYTGEFVLELINVTEELKVIAGGDLSLKANMVSEKDTIGKEVNAMLNNLNHMFKEINNASGQVSAGSKQIADGAQTLAQGSTQQAASVQELLSSISEIAQKTRGNAEMAENAARLASEIKSNAEKGSNQMDSMVSAVSEISEASQSISKVIKVIDDIAFQTNILALNAAVEAARAGQHGKGFAVVAEEVRNLAAKSAEAAKETSNMIQNSMSKAELGNQIAGETANSLHEIVSGINESTKLVVDIAKSSDEQSIGIEHINRGIDQVAQVVQQNSATAQQSAAASEEMSGQAHVLEELVENFKLRESTGSKWNLPEAGGTQDYQVFSQY